MRLRSYACRAILAATRPIPVQVERAADGSDDGRAGLGPLEQREAQRGGEGSAFLLRLVEPAVPLDLRLRLTPSRLHTPSRRAQADEPLGRPRDLLDVDRRQVRLERTRAAPPVEPSPRLRPARAVTTTEVPSLASKPRNRAWRAGHHEGLREWGPPPPPGRCRGERFGRR